jgi:mannitol-1-phosphate 5-dehydrogenase
MKLAVHFGAGNIGRGFIAPVLQENDYKVTFVDINKELIDKVNSLKKYNINSLGIKNNTSLLIEDIEGVNLNDTSSVNNKLAEADLITTSVGPKFVQDIFTTASCIKTNKNKAFIAFENMYRASTSSSNEKTVKHLTLIDAVVDKIVPPQDVQSLDVTVEEYGSIILDEETELKPLKESLVVSYKNYENEFYKKLWLLNGLHLKLAYFGLSHDMKFIHEVLENELGRKFAEDSISALAKAYNVYSNTNENLNEFSQNILNRFSLPELQDEVNRVARNPEIKFSLNERFEKPLRHLISEKIEVETFKKILDIIFEDNFEKVDGFNEFKTNQLSKGRTSFYNEFWNVDSYIEKYNKRLGM